MPDRNKRFYKKIVQQGKYKGAIHVAPIRYVILIGTLSIINAFLHDLIKHHKSEQFRLREIIISLAILLEKAGHEILIEREAGNFKKLFHIINNLYKNKFITSDEKNYLHDFRELRNSIAHSCEHKKIYFQAKPLFITNRITSLVLNVFKIINNAQIKSNTTQTQYHRQFEKLVTKFSSD